LTRNRKAIFHPPLQYRINQEVFYMNNNEVQNRGLNEDVFDFILKRYTKANCHETLGFQFIYLGPGQASLKIYPQPEYSTPGGRVHGGMIAVLADTVMGAAAVTIDGQVFRTVELNINYIAPAYENRELRGEAQVVHPGKTIRVVESSLFDDQGKLVARSKGTFIRDIKFTTERGKLNIL
jgi:uncharacterized protein (TIGR00369 family)